MNNITTNPDGSVASVNGFDFNQNLIQSDFLGLNSSFPTVTSNPATFDSNKLVADLAYAVGQDNWNGFIRNDPLTIPEVNVPPSYFAGSGDPRYPMDVAMQDVYNVFLPRLQAYTELLNAGGCQIINNYICDSDGVPIVQTSSTCSLSGSIETLKIQPQQVLDFVKTSISANRQSQSDAFVDYLNSTYVDKGFTITLLEYDYLFNFVVKVSKPQNPTVYLKYFYDQKDYISSQLNIALTLKNLGDPVIDSGESSIDFIKAMQQQPMLFTLNS